MKKFANDSNQFHEMVLVPKQMLQKVQENQEKILLAIEEMPNQSQNPKGLIASKFIPEATAKELLGKGTTWFWQQRKSGKLPHKKVGNRIYYSMQDIESLIENSNPLTNQDQL